MSKRKQTILLVEDDLITAKIEIKQLEKRNYNVIHAIDSSETIKIIWDKNHHIDLILMDIDLGDEIDGTKIAEEILESKDIPIIFLSNHTEPEIVEKTETISSYGYVVKDCGITVLDASIKMAFKLFNEKQNVRTHQQELTTSNEQLEATNEELSASFEEMESTNEELIQTNQQLIEYQREILEKKNMLRNSEAHLNSVFRAAPTGIGVVIDRILVDANERLSSMTGYSYSELLNQNARMLYINDADYEYVGKEKYDQIKKFGTGTVETQWKCKDGQIIDVLLSSTPLDTDELLKGVTFTALDITEFKKTEKALFDSKEQLMLITNIMPVLLCYVDSSKKYLYVNKAYADWHGYKKDKIIGKQVCDILSKELYSGAVKKIDATLKGETLQFENISKDTNGNEKYVRASYIPHFDENKKVKAFVAMVEDITEHKLAENKIKNLLNEKDLLLKEVHHRIKNNMNVIKNLLLLQADSIDSPDTVAAFNDATARIDSMSFLYDKMYRNETYKDILIDDYLPQLIDEIFELFSGKKSIVIKKQIDSFSINTKIIFPLGIIINELLTNTMKHAFTDRDNGLIEISAKKNKNNVTVIFQDNGIGIQKLKKNSQEGFGLKLINLLTKQINGTNKIEINNGTKFIIEFNCIQ